VLNDEPQLLLGLAEHRSQVHLVTVVEPIAFLVAFDLGQRLLVGRECQLRFRLKVLLHCLYCDLALPLVAILVLLFAQDFTRALVLQRLRLQLFALEVEEAKRIFFPRLGLDVQPMKCKKSKRVTRGIYKDLLRHINHRGLSLRFLLWLSNWSRRLGRTAGPFTG